MMGRFRLTSDHPTIKKLDKLFAFADELGLSIEFLGNRTVIMDSDHPDLQFDFDDIEDESVTGSIVSIPYNLGYKLTYENDD